MPTLRSAPTAEGSLRIGGDDVELFAAASGDRNPLHLDAQFARRTAFGEPVVHGALVTLALLGLLPDDALAAARGLRVSFSGPVLRGIDAAAAAGLDDRLEGGWWATLSARGKEVTRLRLWSAGGPLEPPGEVDLVDDAPMRDRPAVVDVVGLSESREVAGAYHVGPELLELARRWDVAALDPSLLQGLAWASYVVGMELPGLHGLLAGIVLAGAPATAAATHPGRHRVRVGRADPRTSRLLLDGVLVSADASRTAATIEAFGRPAPLAPEPLAGGAARAPGNTGAIAIIGGSRGFGASLALELLGRGHSVEVVYAQSTEAAEQVRLASGSHQTRLTLHRADARDAAAMERLAEELRDAGTPLRGLVLNSAPPPLGMRMTAATAGELADYVADSVRHAAAPLACLAPLLAGDDAWLLLCSSAALDAPPLEWPHYVAAKGALEGLARWAAASRPEVRTAVLRAPRMRTDFTSSPSGGIGGASAASIARWVADRIADLGPGFSVLEPPPGA